MTTNPSPKNTSAFYAQSAISFGVAVVAVGVAITYLPVDAWIRAFLALGALFLVTSTFTLAKCVRDQQESGSVLSRLDQVRLERLLAEFDPYNTSVAPIGGHNGALAGALNPAGSSTTGSAMPPAYPVPGTGATHDHSF